MIKNGVTYKIIHDPGTESVRYIVDVNDGSLVQEIDYDEMGNVTLNTNPTFQPLGFAGGLYDADTKLVRFGARDYDPVVGRWTTKDPIGFAGGDTNLYAYVSGDPMSYVDPSGLRLVFGSDTARNQLGPSLAQIWTTGAGHNLITQLNQSSSIYTINMNNQDQNYQLGNQVTVDPASRPLINASPLGVIPASTTRILAHELGHLTGTKDFGNMNVNAWENPIMNSLEGFSRTSYGTGGIRCGK